MVRVSAAVLTRPGREGIVKATAVTALVCNSLSVNCFILYHLYLAKVILHHCMLSGNISDCSNNGLGFCQTYNMHASDGLISFMATF